MPVSGEQRRRQRTLIVGANWLGDTVMSLPALEALRECAPQDEIHVGAPYPLVGLIRMAASVDVAWGWPPGGFALHGARHLRARRYDRAILLPNSFRAAWVTRIARIHERWGYTGQWRRWLLNRPIPRSKRPRGAHLSLAYLEIIRAMGWNGEGIPRIRISIPDAARKWMADRLGGKDPNGLLIALCPGAAYGPAKRWPLERFAETARALRDRRGARIVLLGNARESLDARALSAMVGPGVLDLSGQTDGVQLAAALASCHMVLSNDSGPMHLAAAVGTPVVALFGSTDPRATAPIGPHRIVRVPMDCSPCLKRRCPDASYRCLAEITVEQVLVEAESLLETSAGSGGKGA